jgi:hypothetical protein
MFRWLIEQHFVVANPFSGIKVRSSARSIPMDEGRVFSEDEWAITRAVANGLEWSYGWKLAAAQRLRFVLDFAYATGLRFSEFVGSTVGQIDTDAQGDQGLKQVSKGSKAGKVALPPLARVTPDHYLMQRGAPTTFATWKLSTPIIADLQADNGQDRITSTRLWNVTKWFFETSADAIESESPKTAEKLCNSQLDAPHPRHACFGPNCRTDYRPVGHDELGDTTKEGQCLGRGTQPIGHSFSGRGIRKGVARRSRCRHEDVRALATTMNLAHGALERLGLQPVVHAELGVAVGLLLPVELHVLLPKQHQRLPLRRNS